MNVIKKLRTKSVLAILMAFLMIISLMPQITFAADETEASEPVYSLTVGTANVLDGNGNYQPEIYINNKEYRYLDEALKSLEGGETVEVRYRAIQYGDDLEWVTFSYSYTLNGEEHTESIIGVESFTMPEADVTVTSVVQKLYGVYVDTDENGSISISDSKGVVSLTDSPKGNKIGYVKPREKVQIGINPDSGYKLDSLSVTGADLADDYTFIMPVADVTVTPSFAEDIPVHEHTWSTEGVLTEASYSVEEGIIPGYVTYTCTECGETKNEEFTNQYQHEDATIYVTGKDGENHLLATWVYVEPKGDGKGTYYDKATGKIVSIIKDFTDPANQKGETAGYTYDVSALGCLVYAGWTRKPVNPGRQSVTVVGILMEDLIDYTSQLAGGVNLRGNTYISWTASDGSTKAGTQIYSDFYTKERKYFPSYFIDQTFAEPSYYMPFSLAIVGFQAAQGEVESIEEEIGLADSMNAIRNFQGQLDGVTDGNLGNLSTQGIVGFLFEPVYNDITLIKDEGIAVTSADSYLTASAGENVVLTITAEDEVIIKITDADGETVEFVRDDDTVLFTMPETEVTVTVAYGHEHIFGDNGFCSSCGEYDPEAENYTVSTAAQLAEIARAANAGDTFTGKMVTLSDDISLSETDSFSPIGGNTTRVDLQISSQEELDEALEEHFLIYDSNGKSYVRASEKNQDYDSNRTYYYLIGAAFGGVFDGAGYAVTGLNIQTTEGYAGLFGNVTGTVKNLTVRGIVHSTTRDDFVGGISGKLSAGGVLENCRSYVDVSSNGYNTGGVVGFVGEMGTLVSDDNPIATVRNCAFYGTVTSASQRLGGIAGRNAGLIEGCANHGTVITTYARKNGVGGIVGMNGVNNAATDAGIVRNCYNDGIVNTNGCFWSGGICGFQNALSSMDNCYSAGILINGKNPQTGAVWSQTNPTIGQNEGKADSLLWLDKDLDSTTDTYRGSDASGIYNAGGVSTNVEGWDDTALRSSEAAAFLNGESGDSFKENCGGYPVLSWESADEHQWDEGTLTEATCEKDGSLVYTCTVCGATKTEVIPATGHKIHVVDAKKATCTEDGNDLYYECEICGKVFADEAGEEELEEIPVIKAEGHDYGEITDDSWIWTPDEETGYTVTLSLECSKCHDKQSIAASVRSVVNDATCTEDGKVFYAAAASFDGNVYVTTKSEVIPAHGHSWNEPVWTWTGDDQNGYTAASMTLVCPVCKTTEKFDAQVVFTETAGKDIYTASVVFEEKTYTDVREVSGYHINVRNIGVEATENINAKELYSGEVEFTVDSDQICGVAVEYKTGDFETLSCTTGEDGKHIFTINVEEETNIIVFVKGDADMNGMLEGKDATLTKKAAIGASEFSDLQILIADVNGDGLITAKDGTLISKYVIGAVSVVW